MRIAALVAACWMVAFALPFVILGLGARPDMATYILFGALMGYFVYTGYSAWRRGWKARFVLRAVMPGALFAVAWVIAGLIKWRG